VVGLIAPSLAFGRVAQIFKAMETLLEIMDMRPLRYIMELGQSPLLLFSLPNTDLSGVDL